MAQPGGEQHASAKLTDADVLAIREAIAARTATHKALAKRYGVTRQAIGKIARRETWQHVGGPPPSKLLATNTTGHRGVTFSPINGNRYSVSITVAGKRTTLGWVKDPVEGARLYDRAVRAHGLPRERCNFPDEGDGAA